VDEGRPKIRHGSCVEKPSWYVRAFLSVIGEEMPPLMELVFSTQGPSPGNQHPRFTGGSPVPREDAYPLVTG